MSHDNPESHGICAHEGCSCVVNKDSAIQHDSALYCSQGCADGVGCDCQGCNCNGSSEAQPTINRPR